MSYCRWSSDDFRCDVYVYEDVCGGWTTHVAGNRIVGEIPRVPDITTAPQDEWARAYQKQTAFLDGAKHEPIGGPHDGETFNDPSPSECADRLDSLRADGYTVPQHAIDELRDEAKGPTDEQR